MKKGVKYGGKKIGIQTKKARKQKYFLGENQIYIYYKKYIYLYTYLGYTKIAVGLNKYLVALN